MLESLPVLLLVSTILGFLAGIGIGGGSLLILWLTLILGMEHLEARLFNLLFFLPSAAIACLFRWKQGVIDIKRILPVVISGCLTSILGSWLSSYIDIEIFKKAFGVLLILTGIRELTYRPENNNRTE